MDELLKILYGEEQDDGCIDCGDREAWAEEMSEHCFPDQCGTCDRELEVE